MDHKSFHELQLSSLRGMKMESAFSWVIDNYKNVRIDMTDLENDGDMLLFQWGTNSWNQSGTLFVELTRQFMFGDGDDQDIVQLACRFIFKGSTEVGGDQWCGNPMDANTMIETISQNKWYDQFRSETPVLSMIEMNSVE